MLFQLLRITNSFYINLISGEYQRKKSHGVKSGKLAGYSQKLLQRPTQRFRSTGRRSFLHTSHYEELVHLTQRFWNDGNQNTTRGCLHTTLSNNYNLSSLLEYRMQKYLKIISPPKWQEKVTWNAFPKILQRHLLINRSRYGGWYDRKRGRSIHQWILIDKKH